MGHHHDHSTKNLKLAFFLNLAFTILEIFGGIWVNSIAILSDALHDLGDSFSISLSWILHSKSKKEPTTKFTFGYLRFSLIGAFLNGMILSIGSVFIFIEAFHRIKHPETADAKGMILFAIIGVAVNGYATFKVGKGKTLNEKMIAIHLLEDVLGWIAVLIAAIIMLIVDVPILDPILSLLITIYILFNVIKRLRETLNVFLQGKPENIDLDKVKSKILELENVRSLHHTHLWSLDGEHHVFTTHVVLEHINNLSQSILVKEKIKSILSDFNFSHFTIETEYENENCTFR